MDDQEQPVEDYFLEFFSPEDKEDREAVFFQREVLAHVHQNTMRKHFRCLYIDRTDLMYGYYRWCRQGRSGSSR